MAVTRNAFCLPNCSYILQTDYVRRICGLNGFSNRTIIVPVRATAIGKITQYGDLFARIGSPLCINRQILAKGGSLKGSCASGVEIPTTKGVVTHCGSRKGDLLANNAGNRSRHRSVAGISVLESDRSDKVLTTTGAIACIVDCVTESCNYAILYGSFKSALCIGVNLFTDRASVIFLVTRGETGCSDCFCLCKIVGASKLIYGSVFVALFVTNGTFLVLNTISCKGRLNVNHPFIFVSDLTDGAASVAFGVAGIRPSVADCRDYAIGVDVAAYATGVRGVTIIFTSRSSYNCIVAVFSESRNYAIRYSSFNSTLCIGVNLIAFGASVIFLVTIGLTGCSGCRCLCECMRTTIGKSNLDNNSKVVTGVCEKVVAFNRILHMVRSKDVIAGGGTTCT